MVFTTAGSVEAMMGFNFTDSTKPTTTEVTNVFIPMADRKVTRVNVPSASDEDKSDMSTLWTSHLITLSKDIDFRNQDISINSERVPTNFSMAFNDIVADKGGSTGGKSFFKVANITKR